MQMVFNSWQASLAKSRCWQVKELMEAIVRGHALGCKRYCEARPRGQLILSLLALLTKKCFTHPAIDAWRVNTQPTTVTFVVPECGRTTEGFR
jgi:hypothetical protein